MHSTKGTFRGRAGLASAPLAVAYAAIPLGTGFAAFLNGTAQVSATLPWLVLSGIGAVLAMHRSTPGDAPKKGFLFKATLFLLMVVGLVIYAADILAALAAFMPYFKESVPLVFMLFCLLWASTCGLPDRGDFQRYGALLGVLCLLDLVAEGALYQAAPTVRWIGNADMLAGLLLVSICAGLRPGDNDGGVNEPDQGKPVWRALALLGLLACLSRTGLFGAAWVVLCFGRGRFLYRASYGLLCAGLITLTLFLPPTATDSVRYIDYWMWVETLRLFAETPLRILTGYPVGMPLPVDFPAGMGPIWETATGSPSLLGAYLPHIPSFWLRMTLAWGIIVPLALLSLLFVLLFRRLTRMGAGLTAALFAQGMSTPLLYDPTMAATIGLAFILALSSPARRTNAKRDEPVMQPEETSPVPSPDPVKEWDLKPL